jgi:hypothetical protein
MARDGLLRESVEARAWLTKNSHVPKEVLT